MRVSAVEDHSRTRQVTPVPALIFRLRPQDNDDESPPGAASSGAGPVAREDLPYKVELWNGAKTGVERVLAVTASGSIGYAAFYGATREFPDRFVTLRHRNSIISRWNGPRH